MRAVGLDQVVAPRARWSTSHHPGDADSAAAARTPFRKRSLVSRNGLSVPGCGHLPGHPGQLLGVAAASGLQRGSEGFEPLACPN